ncbi:MAG: response regulator [Candidatus Omnitrophota bacterium]
MGSVLVVDDNRDLGMLTSEILVERGFRVNIAFDGETALKRIKREPYDLMILDYRLPGISGLTVLEKTQQIRPNLKTIMISAFGNDSTRAKAQELGAYAFLDKPFDIDGLVKVVKKTLSKGKHPNLSDGLV